MRGSGRKSGLPEGAFALLKLSLPGVFEPVQNALLGTLEAKAGILPHFLDQAGGKLGERDGTVGAVFCRDRLRDGAAGQAEKLCLYGQSESGMQVVQGQQIPRCSKPSGSSSEASRESALVMEALDPS